MSANCPCCGRPTADLPVTWSPTARSLIVEGGVIEFSKLQAAIFDTLWRLRPLGGAITAEQIAARVYTDFNGGPDGAANSVKVTIWRLMRTKLRGTVVSINGRPNNGYRICVDASARRLAA